MVTIQQRVYEPIAMGEYPATVTTVEPIEGQYGSELQFNFTLDQANKIELRA